MKFFATNPYPKKEKKGALLLFAVAMLLWTVHGAEEAHVAAPLEPASDAPEPMRYPLPHELLDSSGVVSLTDETFEHTTQASTGQTTGSWLLWFYNDTATNDDAEEMFFTDAFPALDVWQDIHVVVAVVNVRKAPQTHQRFLSVKHDPLPALLYLHHGKLYRYPYASSSSSSLTYSWSALLQFCQNPTEVTAVAPEDIPPPPDWLHWTIAKLAASPALLSGVMVAIMVLGALLGALLEYVVPPKKATTTAIATATGAKKKDE